ncbi:hypothetical protein PM082_009092 [Marasmius tenuissimus]|nr:hypothetical protein PM082_009092 [Marasmius tenuissimus]
MLRLSRNSGLHPTCLSIRNVKMIGKYPIAAGGFGDVWKGTIGDSSELVCLKVVKVYMSSDLEKLTNEYQREAILWRQLKHPNVLPFLGIYKLETGQLCLISPWMEKGNLVEFLKATKREDVDHYTLAYDVASGLAYLHSRKIVHVDLKGLNILITGSLRARITDFGLSRIKDSKGLRVTTSAMRPVGTARWLAPELLTGSGGPTTESDIYSYGCVCYEIFTGLQPYAELANEMAVAFNVAQGNRPSRPEGISELSDAMWALMTACWDAEPSLRPTADRVLGKIARMTSKGSFSPASDWSGSLSAEMWENIEYRFRSPPSPGEAGTPPTPQSEVSPAPMPPPVKDTVIFKAEALHTYTSEDPDNLCFLAGVALDILKAETLWWRARAPDGTIGMIPANHVRILGEVPVDYARALNDYSAPPEDSDEFSFAKGDILNVLSRNGDGWLVQDANGVPGVVPSNFLIPSESVFGDLDPSTVLERLLSPRRRRRQFPNSQEIPSQLQFDGTPPLTTRPEGITVASNEIDDVIFKAEALRSVTHVDSSYLSFVQGMVMDILDVDGLWWRARAPDGTIGMVKSTCIRVLEKAPVDYARALYDYSALPGDPYKFSFAKDDILDVLNKNGDQWDVRKTDGTLGTAPPNFLILFFDGHDSLAVIERLRHQRRFNHSGEAKEPGVAPSNFSIDDREWATEMIGFLTCSDVDSWEETEIQKLRTHVAFVRTVAKEVVIALGRGLKYEAPRAQYLTVKLWALLLQYPSKHLVNEISSRGFLDTLEDVLDPQRSINSAVREILLGVVALAAHDIGDYDNTPFRQLWRRFMPLGSPDEGIPLGDDRPIFDLDNLSELWLPSDSRYSLPNPLGPSDSVIYLQPPQTLAEPPVDPGVPSYNSTGMGLWTTYLASPGEPNSQMEDEVQPTAGTIEIPLYSDLSIQDAITNFWGRRLLGTR